MKQTKIIPFNWEFYQANKDKCRVITSHMAPIEVTQLHKFNCLNDCSLFGVMNNIVWGWYDSGSHIQNKATVNDLQLEVAEEVVEYWVNVYEYIDGKISFTGMRHNKEDCIANISETENRKYICTIPLHEFKSDEA